MVTVTPTIEMNLGSGAFNKAAFNNAAFNVQGTFVDVTADVFRDPIRLRRGIFGSGPLDQVAAPGTLAFTLNNSEYNSTHTAGYYSPGHASCRSGFGYDVIVRLKL